MLQLNPVDPKEHAYNDRYLGSEPGRTDSMIASCRLCRVRVGSVDRSRVEESICSGEGEEENGKKPALLQAARGTHIWMIFRVLDR